MDEQHPVDAAADAYCAAVKAERQTKDKLRSVLQQQEEVRKGVLTANSDLAKASAAVEDTLAALDQARAAAALPEPAPPYGEPSEGESA